MRALLLAICLSGCLGEYDVDEMVYPCRSEEDCVEGFECHESRYVCVEEGTQTASVTTRLDAGR